MTRGRKEKENKYWDTICERGTDIKGGRRGQEDVEADGTWWQLINGEAERIKRERR